MTGNNNRYHNRALCSEIISHENACQEYAVSMLDHYVSIDEKYTQSLFDKNLHYYTSIHKNKKHLIMFDSLKKLILDFMMCCHTKMKLSTPTLLLSFKILEKYIFMRNKTHEYLQELIEDRLQFQLIGIVSLWIASKYIDTKYKHFTIDTLLELISAPQYPKSYWTRFQNEKNNKTGSSMSTPIATPKLVTPLGKTTNSKEYNYDSMRLDNSRQHNIQYNTEKEYTENIQKITNKRNSLKRHVKTIELDILNKLDWSISDIPTNDFFIDISLRALQAYQESTSAINSKNFLFFYDTNDINQLKFGSQMLSELVSFHCELFKNRISIHDISNAALQVMKLAILNYKMDRFVHLDKNSIAYKIVKLFGNCHKQDQLPFSFKLKYFPKNTIQYPVFLKSLLRYVDKMYEINEANAVQKLSKVLPTTPITPDLIKNGSKRSRQDAEMDSKTLVTNQNNGLDKDYSQGHLEKKKLMFELRRESNSE
ncbi:cyclin [Hanseniaspora uvarum]|nr:cyclin [Hanseniaspora uvarum]